MLEIHKGSVALQCCSKNCLANRQHCSRYYAMYVDWREESRIWSESAILLPYQLDWETIEKDVLMTFILDTKILTFVQHS